jgi:hypothetical protein
MENVYESRENEAAEKRHSYLKSKGIRCRLKSITHSYPSGMPMSSKVLVHKNDVSEARRLLFEFIA